MRMKNFNIAVLLLLHVSILVECYCPAEKVNIVKPTDDSHVCSIRISCIGTVRDVKLPESCYNNNTRMYVDLFLSDAIERVDPRLADVTFLKFVYTLRISANWKEAPLSFLQYVPNVNHVYLYDDNIQDIPDSPFFDLIDLRTLDLSHNNLSEIEDLFSFNATNKLEKLSLSHNNIDLLPSETFAELTALVELDLSYNIISNLEEEPFFNLTHLEILRLNNNRIKDLNGAVTDLLNLKHLYLRGNSIENIDEGSEEVIYQLQTFDMSNNQLDKLQPSLLARQWNKMHLKSMCKINLSNNKITHIPNGTLSARLVRHSNRNKGHVASTDLNLSKNEITAVSYNAFHTIEKLNSLDLSSNKLKHLFLNSDDLVYLKFLNLRENLFTNLYYDSFSPMSHLQNLDLSYNKVDYIPAETFSDNVYLKNVNLAHNIIKNMKNLHIKLFNFNGGQLDLSNNGLTRITIPFDEGLRLRVLYIQSNNISDAANININYQTNMKTIVMSRNQIRMLNENSLRMPVSLTYLDMSINLIEKIEPSTFSRLKHLQVLRLAHNKLSSITYGSFQGLEELKKLDLSQNQIGYLDSKLLGDLKSLDVLSLNFNEMNSLNNEGWVNHKTDVKVYVEGNNLTCEWMKNAIKDYENGYSKMLPAVREVNSRVVGPTVEGIPCKPDMSMPYREGKSIDEKLLVTNQKILEAIKNQTSYLKNFLWINYKKTKTAL